MKPISALLYTITMNTLHPYSSTLLNFSNFSLAYDIILHTGAYPCSYTVGTGSESEQGVKMTTQLHLVFRLRMYVELYLHFPIHIHGMVLKLLYAYFC
jgi:hypothetical protein